MSGPDRMWITLPDGHRFAVDKGQSLLEILAMSGRVSEHPVVAAKLNNRLTNLRHRIRVDSTVEFIDCTHPEGFRVYQASLVYLLVIAVRRLFPEAQLKVEHSLSRGLYCELDRAEPLTEADLGRVEAEMRALVARDLPLDKVKTYLDEARAFFRRTGQTDKIRLFQHSNPHTVNLYHCDGHQEYSDCPLAAGTGVLGLFRLVFHPPGLVMMMAGQYSAEAGAAVTEVPEFVPLPRLFAVFREYDRWLGILRLSDIGALNERVVDRRSHEVVRISEALHEKKIAQLADAVAGNRIVLIGGPSSSGKTTFSMRLSDQLRVLGREPVAVALDDYFLDRRQTPRDARGEYDFESLRALDLELLRRHFQDLAAGRPAELPRFDFQTGRRVLGHRRVEVGPDTVLLFEGIHAINPELVRQLPAGRVVSIYVSPLTTLGMDHHNRIPTTDVRLLRRIVRDYLFRGYDARETLRRWQMVRQGEMAYIFPYQNDADLFFNSALVYELGVLKRHAEPLLVRISTECPEYSEARRLLKFLSYFQDIPAEDVPSNSLLREFIGRSAYRY